MENVPDHLPEASDLMLEGQCDHGPNLASRLFRVIAEDPHVRWYTALGALEIVKVVILKRLGEIEMKPPQEG